MVHFQCLSLRILTMIWSSWWSYHEVGVFGCSFSIMVLFFSLFSVLAFSAVFLFLEFSVHALLPFGTIVFINVNSLNSASVNNFCSEVCTRSLVICYCFFLPLRNAWYDTIICSFTMFFLPLAAINQCLFYSAFFNSWQISDQDVPLFLFPLVCILYCFTLLIVKEFETRLSAFVVSLLISPCLSDFKEPFAEK